ncbi:MULTISPECIES: ABC transporter substrate-binding protein [unclassified Paenibacillus]|uniref:ABC transporter substrate-binding protein n=1 Tax=unclassified Paenibacillus TaxID=185978 RepID=UPI0009A89A00|nr:MULTISPECIES: ABC transporter substrate-binding protein [unclassified Paenibacillus]SLJ90791.1 iron complex transport system substrate-binding protein [Paenibacillus sp. RU5A]SOC58932.1 iron complex transport system substrate-binding protein [Paenibacillus sp. RU26A]SOC67983.1 iron complex transport system substrate-binding protein [Paenibacillus sp. RU5M]
MKKGIRNTAVLLTVTWLSILLLACGNQASTPSAGTDDSKTANETQTDGDQSKQEQTASTDNSEGETRMFKDWTGHEVEVPVTPKRVIYHGEVTGDLLALGVVPVGILRQDGTVYDDQVAQAEDVGFPMSVEKALTLNPDLIIFSNSDQAQYDQISKVAPTVTFDSFASLDDRMRTLGDLLNKKPEAEAWITAHQKATEEMWKQLHENGLKEGETASVFTMYPGNRLFVMAGAGLPQLLYGADGMKPTAEIQKVLDEGMGFAEISTEKLPEIAGDRVFILNPVTDHAKQSTKELLDSPIWKNLPAVKEGKVYRFDLVKASSDATSREWLLKELPKQMIK